MVSPPSERSGSGGDTDVRRTVTRGGCGCGGVGSDAELSKARRRPASRDALSAQRRHAAAERRGAALASPRLRCYAALEGGAGRGGVGRRSDAVTSGTPVLTCLRGGS
eukprot:362032-Chlamydomonas_euryale.AAC.4